ncbi:hypothetical protein [Microbulbifer sp. Q7]|uniref:hypothetical protein n=1 Tax=Microbulbifer sp. Q7 TaxID=1785091 RepID=UPI000AB1A66F|nr:hypothetical protein [Microbulbifer sp. Q7]
MPTWFSNGYVHSTYDSEEDSERVAAIRLNREFGIDLSNQPKRAKKLYERALFYKGFSKEELSKVKKNVETSNNLEIRELEIFQKIYDTKPDGS